MSDTPRTDEYEARLYGDRAALRVIDELKRQLAAKDAELSTYRQWAEVEIADLRDDVKRLNAELCEAKKKYLLVCAQHGRLVDQVYEEDGETLKQDRLNAELAELQNAFEDEVTAREQAESRAAAADDLLRECLDWGLPKDLKERIDVAMGERDA